MSRGTEFELKPIDESYLVKALEKAEHYRLLNWPEEAESICLDVLHTDDDNQRAIQVLVLALSDLFAQPGSAPRVKQAKGWVAKVQDAYLKTYLTGIIHEREGRAHLSRGFHGSFAYECFHDAMKWYQKAEALQPAGNQEAALRFNSCVRTIEREKLQPRDDEGPESMLE